MDKSILASVAVDEQSIEHFATNQAEAIVEIDMTTPEYTADTCLMADDNLEATGSNPLNMSTPSK